MDPVELSICANRDQQPTELLSLLERFKPGCKVSVIPWENEWADLSQAAFYRHGPDVSQVGSSMIGDIVSMEAVRLFNAREIASFGGASAFSPPAWESAHRAVDRQKTWAVPWLADPRLIYYWRDMLEQAGVKELSAFQTFEAMETTLARLRANGVTTPWVLPTTNHLAAVQTSASWIWGAGGDFVNASGRRTLFNYPDARTGLKVYFGLYRYMPPTAQPLDAEAALQVFRDRQAAVTMGSSRLGEAILHSAPPEIRSQLGFALPPGPPLVGGSSLIIWKYSLQGNAAVELVRFLTSTEIQLAYCQQAGYLPTRLDALAAPPFSTEPHFRGLARALTKGRPYTPRALGGLLEDKIGAALVSVWADLIAAPDQDLELILTRWLEPLARRLDLTLSSFS